MAEGDIVSRDIVPLFSKQCKRDMVSIVIFTKDRDNIFPISKNIDGDHVLIVFFKKTRANLVYI